MRHDRADRLVPHVPELEEAILTPREVHRRIDVAHQIQAGGVTEVALTVLAVAAALARPTIREDAVDRVHAHDLASDLGHELEVVRTQCAGDPQLRVRPVAYGLALGVPHDPIWMRFIHIIVHRVRIGACNHGHAELPTALVQLPERVTVAEESAPIVQRNLRRIVRHAATRAQTRRVAVRLLEEVEPEVDVVLDGIVLDERELCPAHRTVEKRVVHEHSSRTVTSRAGAVRLMVRASTVAVAPQTVHADEKSPAPSRTHNSTGMGSRVGLATQRYRPPEPAWRRALMRVSLLVTHGRSPIRPAKNSAVPASSGCATKPAPGMVPSRSVRPLPKACSTAATRPSS